MQLLIIQVQTIQINFCKARDYKSRFVVQGQDCERYSIRYTDGRLSTRVDYRYLQ